jgi:hypothetical protein
MDRLSAPQQNRMLGGIADLLRKIEQDSGPEFLPKGLDVMGLVRQLALPSAETVEKLSYGDPLFRMPTQSNIPITTDRDYLAEVLGLAPAASAASRATTRISNEVADALVRQITRNPEATAPGALQAAGEMFPLAGVYRKSTPLKPDPEVGTRFEREYIGGLAEKTPVKIEDLQGASAMIMPWDSTSRNMRISSISEETLPRPVITHGGQDYSRDLAHIERGVGGASNLSIAKRIRDRDAIARQENIEAGGSGKIIHLPTTMGEGSENFSIMPTEALLGILDTKQPSKKMVKDIDDSIRNYKVPKGTGEKRVITQPFKNFKGIMTEEGRMQLYTGEGLGSTAGELRKAFVDRLVLKENQQALGFNAEDLSAALTDPALVGVPKGYSGNTVLMTDEAGMHLLPASNPTYSTDFTAKYLGTLGQSVPTEVLFPRLFPSLMQEMGGKKGDVRNMVLGAMEKRKSGVSELIDQQVIDNYYNYLEQQKLLGLLD